MENRGAQAQARAPVGQNGGETAATRRYIRWDVISSSSKSFILLKSCKLPVTLDAQSARPAKLSCFLGRAVAL